jgi:hypothetical protein
MSKPQYVHTYEEFISFCEAAENHNHETFDESNLTKRENGTVEYVGTYRDAENFKNPFYINFNGDELAYIEGSISYVAGPDEAMDELDQIYLELFRSQVFPDEQSADASHAPAGTNPVGGISPLEVFAPEIMNSMQSAHQTFNLILTQCTIPDEGMISLVKQSMTLLHKGIELLKGNLPDSPGGSDTGTSEELIKLSEIMFGNSTHNKADCKPVPSDELQAVATEVRILLEEKYGADNLYGKCIEASELLSARLNELGVPHRIVEGWCHYDDATSCSDRDHDEHSWIETNAGTYIDVTATQFAAFMHDEIPNVIIGKRPSYMKLDKPIEQE